MKKYQKMNNTNKRAHRTVSKKTRHRDRHPIIKKLLTLKPHYQEKKLCCAIRFYDNDPEIIKQFERSKKYVESILVSDKPNKDILTNGSPASLYTHLFLKEYPDNKFAQYLLSVKNKEIFTSIGFSELDYVNLREWTLNRHYKTKVVIFDWDRTLSVIEGVLLPPNKTLTKEMADKGVTYHDIALYYSGGKTRMKLLQKMFKFLHDKGVEVFILTNNPIAACNWRKLNDFAVGELSRENFFGVVKQLNPYMKRQNILCGYETNGFKPDAFSNNTYLREIYARIQHWHYTHSASSNSI